MKYCKNGKHTKIVDPTPDQKWLKLKQRKGGQFVEDNVQKQSCGFVTNKPSCHVGSYKDLKSVSWSRSLQKLPIFTVQDIDDYHRRRSASVMQTSSKIIKPAVRGLQFQRERYISSNTVETATDDNFFYVKANCAASMTKDVYTMSLALNLQSGNIEYAHCTCKAGLGGLDNHSMSLMMEIATYSLEGLTEVPVEASPTSLRCKWIGSKPNDNIAKVPIMNMNICKMKVDGVSAASSQSAGVTCTLYEARNNKLLDPYKISKFQNCS